MSCAALPCRRRFFQMGRFAFKSGPWALTPLPHANTLVPIIHPALCGVASWPPTGGALSAGPVPDFPPEVLVLLLLLHQPESADALQLCPLVYDYSTLFFYLFHQQLTNRRKGASTFFPVPWQPRSHEEQEGRWHCIQHCLLHGLHPSHHLLHFAPTPRHGLPCQPRLSFTTFPLAP